MNQQPMPAWLLAYVASVVLGAVVILATTGVVGGEAAIGVIGMVAGLLGGYPLGSMVERHRINGTDTPPPAPPAP